MPDPAGAKDRLVRFGPFEFDGRAGELRKHGIRIKLREQPVRILEMLLQNPGEVVLRDEIRLRLWPNNTIVEFDHGINAAIQRLRDALGESVEQPRYVETVARRGYRFIGEVEKAEGPVAAPEHGLEPDSLIAAANDLTGQTISHYRIASKLGEGGMGEVWRATDTKLNREVAIKILPEVFSRDAPCLARFQREARLLASLNHPNIAAIHGLEEIRGAPALVMELVEGENPRGPRRESTWTNAG
jgi:DNA-binding winged helix-turn-helix (wHTH) protein